MLRLALWFLFLFSVPFVLTLIWLWLVRKIRPSDVEVRIWVYSSLAGVLLIFLSLIIWRENSGQPPGGEYIPPHTENGEVVPGYFKQNDSHHNGQNDSRQNGQNDKTQ